MRKKSRTRIVMLMLLIAGISQTMIAAPLGELAMTSPGMAAQQGYVDLSGWNPLSPIELNGNWEFFPMQFISPGTERPAGSYLDSGARWDEVAGMDTTGYGTYRLRITLPDEAEMRNLSLLIQEIGTSASIYWNGTLIDQRGTPTDNPAESRPIWRSSVTPTLEWAPEVELLIHVSNYETTMNGIVEPLIIGNTNTLIRKTYANAAVNYFIFGVLGIMAVYHFLLFFFRKNEHAPIWFAATALLLGLRTLVVDSFPITALFPGISQQLLMRLNFLSFSLPLLAVTMFIQDSYPSRWGRIIALATTIGSLLYSLVIIFAPTLIFAQNLIYFQIFALFIAINLFFMVIHAVLGKKDFSRTFGLGFFMILLTSIFDIVKAMLNLPLPSLSSTGMVLFVVILAFNLSIRTTRALTDAEDLSRRLRRINNAMERFVPREFLRFLQREDITDIQLGDNVRENFSILFADIVGFTAISEKVEAEDVFSILNIFLGEMGPIIRKHHGFVDKYLGDGIMALFSGSPADAIHAAIEMQQKLDEINTRYQRQEGYHLLKMGIGIHTGDCMIGTIGEPQRMDGTVISDSVNLSSRLQGLTRTFQARILVSQETLEDVGEGSGFYHRKLGNFNVKGREEMAAVYEIINSDPREVWGIKRKTRRNFQRAVFLYESGNIDEAMALFGECHNITPDDPALLYYLNELAGSAGLESATGIISDAAEAASNDTSEEKV